MKKRKNDWREALKITEEKKKFLKSIIVLFLISLFIETIVFNIASFYTLFGKNNVKKYENPEYLYTKDGFAYLKLNDINMIQGLPWWSAGEDCASTAEGMG